MKWPQACGMNFFLAEYEIIESQNASQHSFSTVFHIAFVYSKRFFCSKLICSYEIYI